LQRDEKCIVPLRRACPDEKSGGQGEDFEALNG